MAEAQTISEDDVPVHLRITKKEVQVLIDELLEGFEESFNPDFPNDLEIETLKASFSGAHSTSAVLTTAPDLIQNQEMEMETKSIVDMNASALLDFHPSEEITGQYIQPLAILNAAPTFASNVNVILGSDNKLYLVPSTTGVEEGEEAVAEHELAEVDPYADDDYEDDGVCIGGWTRQRVRILQRQLLVHVQLTGQMFTQCYSHPEAWRMARDFMEMLESLVEVVGRESEPFLSVLCWNLSDMFEICQNWQRNLDGDSEENMAYVKGLESYEDQKMRQYNRFFPARLAELWITNRAFLFQEYLPTRVVHCYSSAQQAEIVPGELKLLALALKECRPPKQKKMKRGLPGYRLETAEYYATRYNHARPIKYLVTIISRARYMKKNPLEAMSKRGEMPRIEHARMTVGSYEEVVPHAEKPKYTLAKRWNAYVYNADRVSGKRNSLTV